MSWSSKISDTISIKKTIAKAKRPKINDCVDDFADDIGSTLFQGAKDQADKKDCALAYHSCLFLIFLGFNQVELDILFYIILPSFYSRYDKNSIKVQRDIFESAYHKV